MHHVWLENALRGVPALAKVRMAFPCDVENCPASCGHNDYSQKNFTDHVFFAITTRFQFSELYFDDGSHKYVVYLLNYKVKLAVVLEITAITIFVH